MLISWAWFPLAQLLVGPKPDQPDRLLRPCEKNIADDKAVWSNIKLLNNFPIVDNDRDCERPTVCR